jgi:hypothetical protein
VTRPPAYNMSPTRIRRPFPAPSIAVFFGLQALDVLTTILGLRLGAQEGSVFIDRLLRMGPLEGLLISKCLAMLLAAAAFRYKRARVVVFLNYWFAVVIAWNLITIVSQVRTLVQ